MSQVIGQPRIDFSKTADQIRTAKVSDVAMSDYKYAEVTGVTDAAIAVDSEIRTTSSGGETGPVCIWPSVISIRLSTAPIIYVDASHGECRKKVALEHEMQHVAIDRTLIDRYVPIFRSRVAAMAEAIGSISAPSREALPAARERIEEKVNAMLSVVDDALTVDRAAAAQAHDSPEEYRRVSMACPTISVDTPPATPPARSSRLCRDPIGGSC